MAVAKEVGWDPRSIGISVYGQPPDRTVVQSLLNTGADRVVVRPEYVATESAISGAALFSNVKGGRLAGL
jgi:hypothetical protein